MGRNREGKRILSKAADRTGKALNARCGEDGDDNDESNGEGRRCDGSATTAVQTASEAAAAYSAAAAATTLRAMAAMAGARRRQSTRKPSGALQRSAARNAFLRNGCGARQPK